jgi:hypothetical protein
MRKLIVFVALMCAGVAAAAPPVSAQGYPGSTSTSTPAPTSVTIFLGTFGDGAVFIAEFCGFAPGVPVNITFNGGPVSGSFVSGSDGCVRLTIRVLSDGVAVGQPIVAAAGLQLAQSGGARVSINGTEYAANRGSNTLVASGTGANGAPRTVTVRFNLGTADGGAAGGGGLARTGAMLLRWSAAAIALIGVGALLVVADRRRGSKLAG